MDCLDLSKVKCRICITGDECDGRLANLFTKTITESTSVSTKFIDDDYILNMSFSEALVSFTCIQLQQNYGLPETICRKCEHQLIDAIRFIHRTKDNQQILNSCALGSGNTKEEVEDVDLSEDSTYLIEVVNDDEEILVHKKYSAKVTESTDGNDTYCDAEDAVSFLKNAKRDDVVSDSAKTHKVVRKNHSCNYCKKRFLRKSNLVDHLRLHANVRPFECTYCKKSFVQSGNLKSHLRTHTKEPCYKNHNGHWKPVIKRPFQCLLCPKSYSQSSALKVHYRTHTNERNYGCDVCSKNFTNASDLTKHKRIHDPDSKIACEYCDKKFAQRVNYRNHLRSNHAIQDVPAKASKTLPPTRSSGKAVSIAVVKK